MRPFKQQLADTNARLKKAQEDLTSLKTAKSQADQDLQRMTSELSAKITEVAALRAAAADGNDNVELMRQRQVAEFQKLKADGKIPTPANMTMVAISPGTFTMGEGSDAHPVTISKPFFAGKYEVTIAQILVWLNSPGLVFKDEWIDLSDSDCPVRKNGNRFERNTSTSFASSSE